MAAVPYAPPHFETPKRGLQTTMSSISTAMILVLIAAVGASALYTRLSGRKLVRDCWDKLRLAARPLDAWDAHWAAETDRSDIIVCMTTLPSRLELIDATLKSLLHQRRAPAKIRLHVPQKSRREGVTYEVPERLTKLASLEIVHCEEDWGPATKLVPALNDCEPQQRLLVVDDDKLYAPDLVESMERASDERPDIAIGNSGWSVPPDLQHRPVTMWSNLRGKPPARLKSTLVREPRRVDILQGYSGYLVRPAFFDLEELLEGYEGAPPEAFFVDDIWISGHCDAERWVLPTGRFCFVSWLRLRLHDRTSLGQRDAETAPERHPNTVVAQHLHDRWQSTSTRTPSTSTSPTPSATARTQRG